MALFSREHIPPLHLPRRPFCCCFAKQGAGTAPQGAAGAFLCVAGSRPGRAQPCRALLQGTATVVKELLLQVMVPRPAKSAKQGNEFTCWEAPVLLESSVEWLQSILLLPSSCLLLVLNKDQFCLDWLLSPEGPLSKRALSVPVKASDSLGSCKSTRGAWGSCTTYSSQWLPFPEPLYSQRCQDAPVHTCPQVPETTALSNWAGIETTLLFVFFNTHP